MAALIFAIIFWLAGFAVLSGGFFLHRNLRRAGKHLLEHADHEKGKDNSASIALSIEGKIVEFIPGHVIHTVTGVSGSLLIVMGFVALAFMAV
ncbi:hypothetical protein [Sporolactobacillus vineae]|uniref:hypothetical protein n=1 Tax=Sporolactobacillus vineae TaxID=444463 RepID=UPI0002896395|nr:hypothetical protein [Sporolactobacillus vineae]